MIFKKIKKLRKNTCNLFCAVLLYASRQGTEHRTAKITGCGEVWYRAWMGFKRPWVRISTLGPRKQSKSKDLGCFFDFLRRNAVTSKANDNRSANKGFLWPLFAQQLIDTFARCNFRFCGQVSVEISELPRNHMRFQKYHSVLLLVKTRINA